MLIEKFVESEIIRRFLFIPLIVSLFVFLTQLLQMLATSLLFQYEMSNMQLQHDTYFVIRSFNTLEFVLPFLKGISIGLVVGLCFAAIDNRMHRQKDIDGRNGIRTLLRNLLIISAPLWFVILGYSIARNFIIMWPMNHRYHAYPPEMQFFEKLAYLPPIFIALALIWAMVKTLRRYKPRKFSALAE